MIDNHDVSATAMKIETRKEQAWLLQLLGEWDYTSECVIEPGMPTETFEGSENVRSLGGLWLLCEGRGRMPGDGTATMMTLGYDPGRQRFVGTWVGSMMPYLWVYDGLLDTEENVLRLDTEGPCCASGGRIVKQRDVIELKSFDHRVHTAYLQAEDGDWQPFMTTNYRRKNSRK